MNVNALFRISDTRGHTLLYKGGDIFFLFLGFSLSLSFLSVVASLRITLARLHKLIVAEVGFNLIQYYLIFCDIPLLRKFILR